MEEHFTRRPVAGWFTVAAVASLLFMTLGCIALGMNVLADPAKLALDQRALLVAEPAWMVSASAFAFVAGALGALLLVLRRKEAERILLVSLLAMIIWLGGMFATPSFRDLLSTNQIAVLLVVVALTWTIFWFARHSRQRGWLG